MSIFMIAVCFNCHVSMNRDTQSGNHMLNLNYNKFHVPQAECQYTSLLCRLNKTVNECWVFDPFIKLTEMNKDAWCKTRG